MAASETSVANIAMGHLGQEPITDIEADNNKRAKWARRRFDSLRDALLRSHPWDFAIKRVSLAADPTAPDWGFSFRYTLPGDWLRLGRLEDEDALFRQRGQFIHTDEGAPLRLEYVWRNETPAEWNSEFVEVMGLGLAAAICMPLTDDRLLRKEIADQFKQELALARGTDAKGGPNEEWEVDIWLAARV